MYQQRERHNNKKTRTKRHRNTEVLHHRRGRVHSDSSQEEDIIEWGKQLKQRRFFILQRVSCPRHHQQEMTRKRNKNSTKKQVKKEEAKDLRCCRTCRKCAATRTHVCGPHPLFLRPIDLRGWERERGEKEGEEGSKAEIKNRKCGGGGAFAVQRTTLHTRTHTSLSQGTRTRTRTKAGKKKMNK